MRWMRVLLLSALVASATAIVARSADPVGPFDPKIEGWGPFKFGMTMRAVRELPSFKWNSVRNSQPVAAFGANYDLSLQFAWGRLLFARDWKLSGVRLHDGHVSLDQTDCERRFRTAVLGVERYYGPLTPKAAPPHRAGANPRTTFESALSRVGRSVYARREWSVAGAPDEPLEPMVQFAAERIADGQLSVVGWSSISEQLGGDKSRWAGCGVSISIEGKPPANIRD